VPEGYFAHGIPLRHSHLIRSQFFVEIDFYEREAERSTAKP